MPFWQYGSYMHAFEHILGIFVYLKATNSPDSRSCLHWCVRHALLPKANALTFGLSWNQSKVLYNNCKPCIDIALYWSEAMVIETIQNVSALQLFSWYTICSPTCTYFKVTFRNLARSYNGFPSSSNSLRIVDNGMWPHLSGINWSGKNV